MTRRPHGREAAAHKKKSGGLLVGMRSGVRNIAGSHGTPSRAASRFWNVVTALLVLAAAVLLLRRFGVLDF
jgi:hypothetical protein